MNNLQSHEKLQEQVSSVHHVDQRQSLVLTGRTGVLRLFLKRVWPEYGTAD